MEVHKYMMIFSFSLKHDFSNYLRVWKKICEEKEKKLKKDLYYYLRGFPYLRSLLFWLQNALTSICLSRDKTKGQSGKNTTLTPTKTLPKNRTTLL